MTPQETIAHYKIVAKIGEGGMGAVYRAIDTKLAREVAIKVLPDAFANDPDRLARFTREAQVLASLNHPNIAAIYGVEERALVMEMVEGPTLQERLAAGPLPLDDAAPIMDQLVDALEYAHERGIVHRDLKPANIKVTPQGNLKVLDFGLGKALTTEVAPSDPASSPTVTMHSTTAGTLLGTAAYMAPEQAHGRPVDKRADIWSFGVVVYEMVTGKTLFARETITDTLAAVLKEEPDWKPVPYPVGRLLRSCLIKDPRRRLRDIGDARTLLDDAPDAVSVPVPARRGMPWWGAAVLAAALLVTGVLLWRATRPVEHPLTRVSVDLGPDVLPGTSSTVAISPDGRRLVFPARGANGKQLLATRILNQAQTTLLAGTENGFDPFFSPDGEWVGFFADGKLKKISVHGGAPMALCASVNGRGASWGEDHTIVAALNLVGPLSRLPDTGGTPQALTKLRPGEATHRWPQVLPGGEFIVFTASSQPIGHEDAEIEVVSLKTGQVKALLHGAYFGRYLPSGHLLYVHEGVMFGVGFNASRLELRGNPTPLMDDVAANPITGGGQFDFSGVASGSGTLLYLADSGAQKWRVDWLDASGNMRPLIATPGVYTVPRVSPDGKKLAFNGSDTGPQIYDLERETITRITSIPGGGNLVWAPDGKHIVFGNGGSLFWVRTDGVGGAQRPFNREYTVAASSFSPDGHSLAYFESSADTGFDIWVLPLDITDPDHPTVGTPQPFLKTSADELFPQFSPDGRWIAYRSDESGSNQIWVRRFPGGGSRFQISDGGGVYAFWSKNRHELFYEAPDHRIMVVDYREEGDAFIATKPRLWSERQIFYPGVQNLDIAPDGKRFAVLTLPDAASAGRSSFHVTMLFNYFDELKRMIP
jgi:Tol biopolymer transport system component/predicted Ser/Thr protein kinase